MPTSFFSTYWHGVQYCLVTFFLPCPCNLQRNLVVEVAFSPFPNLPLCPTLTILHYPSFSSLKQYSEPLCLLAECIHAQSCWTLWDLISCSLPSSSVHGISQARILEWVAIHFSKESSLFREGIQVSCTAGRFFTIWTTRETQRAISRSNT